MLRKGRKRLKQQAKERQREAGGDKKSVNAKSVRLILPEAIEQKQATDEVAVVAAFLSLQR